MEKLIESEELLSKIIRVCDNHRTDYGNVAMDAIVKVAEAVISGMPEADAKQVLHGVWLWDTKSDYFCSQCSKCVTCQEYADDGGEVHPKYNFCPYCGAEMEE